MGLERVLFSVVNRYIRVAERTTNSFYDSISSMLPFEDVVLAKLKLDLNYHIKVKSPGLKLKTNLTKDAIESLLTKYFSGNMSKMARILVKELAYEQQTDVKHREITRKFGLISIQLSDPGNKWFNKGHITIRYQEDSDPL